LLVLADQASRDDIGNLLGLLGRIITEDWRLFEAMQDVNQLAHKPVQLPPSPNVGWGSRRRGSHAALEGEAVMATRVRDAMCHARKWLTETRPGSFGKNLHKAAANENDRFGSNLADCDVRWARCRNRATPRTANWCQFLP
jgi:hypothetical protein